MTKFFQFRMERPHQFGFGTWKDAAKAAREIEDTYGCEVAIIEVSLLQYRRLVEQEGRYFADLSL